jgi:hypothetical protein
MPTKTKKKGSSNSRPTKKTATAKAPSRTTKRTTPTQVPLTVVSDLFSTQPPPVENAVVAPDSVVLFINGRNIGVFETKGMKLGEFAVQHASRQGIRSFSVYADGAKVDTSRAEASMQSIAKLEIVAKDSRG